MKIASFETAEWIDAWRDRRPMTDDMVIVSRWTNEDGYFTDVSWCRDGEWLFSRGIILAWMPLPEHYIPVEEETDDIAEKEGKRESA